MAGLVLTKDGLVFVRDGLVRLQGCEEECCGQYIRATCCGTPCGVYDLAEHIYFPAGTTCGGAPLLGGKIVSYMACYRVDGELGAEPELVALLDGGVVVTEAYCIAEDCFDPRCNPTDPCCPECGTLPNGTEDCPDPGFTCMPRGRVLRITMRAHYQSVQVYPGYGTITYTSDAVNVRVQNYCGGASFFSVDTHDTNVDTGTPSYNFDRTFHRDSTANPTYPYWEFLGGGTGLGTLAVSWFGAMSEMDMGNGTRLAGINTLSSPVLLDLLGYGLQNLVSCSRSGSFTYGTCDQQGFDGVATWSGTPTPGLITARIEKHGVDCEGGGRADEVATLEVTFEVLDPCLPLARGNGSESGDAAGGEALPRGPVRE
ncbi:MAG: hypothetical protein EBZ59_10505, partial [Planctomycetia bacterium]|nr:hypothetical protein [Planctomycetia bacterium]